MSPKSSLNGLRKGVVKRGRLRKAHRIGRNPSLRRRFKADPRLQFMGLDSAFLRGHLISACGGGSGGGDTPWWMQKARDYLNIIYKAPSVDKAVTEVVADIQALEPYTAGKRKPITKEEMRKVADTMMVLHHTDAVPRKRKRPDHDKAVALVKTKIYMLTS